MNGSGYEAEAPWKGARKQLGPPLRLILAGAALLAFMGAPWPWLTAAAALLILALAVFDPEPWAYLAAFCIPFSFVHRQAGGYDISPADVAVIAAFAGVAIRAILGKMQTSGVEALAGFLGLQEDRLKARLQDQDANARRGWTGLDAAVGFLAIAALASLWGARDLTAGLYALRVLILQPIALYAVIRAGGWPERGLLRLADAFVLGGLALALAGLYHYAVTGYVETAEGVRRLLVPFYDSPNHIALYLGRVIPAAFCLAAFASAGRRRILHGAAAAVMLLCAFLTFSRGTWMIGLPAAALFIALLRGRRAWAAGAGAAALALIALLAATGAARFDPAGETLAARLLLWQGAARMAAAHPLTGVGIGAFHVTYPQFMLPEAWREPLVYHAHNVALDFASMTGLIGLAAFIWVQVGFWRMGLRAYRAAAGADTAALALGLMASMVYALAHGLADTAYFLPDLALAFMLTAGMVAALEQKARYTSDVQRA